MTQVQRWTGVVSANEKGGFVAYGDYLALLDRLEKAEKDAERCKRFIDAMCEETFDTWTNGYRMQQVAMNIKVAMEASK